MPKILANNLKKIIVGTVTIFVVIFLVLTLALAIKTPSAKINNHTFKLYVAKNSKDLQVGLSKYKSIPDTRGMIFVFNKLDYYPFWMKGMQFSIDIIYIKDNKVVTIYKDIKTDASNSTVYYPTEPANMVLEINAGLSKKYGITNGSKVELKNL